MTTDEKIAALKILVGGNESDEVLSTYLNLASQKVIKKRDPFNSRNLTEVPLEYEHVQLELACYMINKRGAEGESSHSENGVSRTYISESKILSSITPLVGVIS